MTLSSAIKAAELDGRRSHRRLYLFWWGGGRWDRDCRFLAVRLSSDARVSEADPLGALTLPEELTINGKVYRRV